MKIATGAEARAVHDLFEIMTGIVTTVPLDRHVIVSVLLKITASIAIGEGWDREELLQALGYTYDMEKFLTPASKDRH